MIGFLFGKDFPYLAVYSCFCWFGYLAMRGLLSASFSPILLISYRNKLLLG